MPDTNAIKTDSSDLVWGARAIGRLLNISERQAFNRLKNCQIKGVKKVGKTYAGSARVILREFQAP